MRKWYSMVLIFTMVIVTLTGCAQDSGGNNEVDEVGEEVKVFRFGHVIHEGSSLHEGALRAAEIIEEKSNGKMKMEVYANSVLGGNREMLEMLQAGTLDAMSPALAFLAGFTDAAMLMDLPYLIINEKHGEMVLDGEIGQNILAKFEEVGMKGICWYFQGWRHLTTSDREVRVPEDMRGLKIRVMENPLHIAHFETLGANAIPMAYAEVLPSLQQGVIDAQENPYANIQQAGFYEVQEYIIETKHLYDPLPVVFSKVSWERLSAEEQKIIEEAFLEAQPYQRELTLELDNKIKEELKETNTIIELSVEDRQVFFDAVQPLYKEWEDRIGPELIEKARALAEEAL
jgi:tripartite ATP-independent transporter DctP family solute receptor